jgi:hypothetical protein
MTYQRKVLPSARVEFTESCRTYGEEFTAAASKWRDDIVMAASTHGKEPLMEVSVEDLLDRLLDDDSQDPFALLNQPFWRYSRQRFVDASWRERARAALAFFRSLSPPWEQRVSQRNFSALGIPDMVAMFAYYEVNHASKCVVFTKFEVWSCR